MIRFTTPPKKKPALLPLKDPATYAHVHKAADGQVTNVARAWLTTVEQYAATADATALDPDKLSQLLFDATWPYLEALHKAGSGLDRVQAKAIVAYKQRLLIPPAWKKNNAALAALMMTKKIAPVFGSKMLRNSITDLSGNSALRFMAQLRQLETRVAKDPPPLTDTSAAARAAAQRIARTETMQAINEGQIEKWIEQAPEEAREKWVTTNDDATCPACASMDGKTVPVDDDFQTPYGPAYSPPLHPNCRCTLVLVFDEEQQGKVDFAAINELDEILHRGLFAEARPEEIPALFDRLRGEESFNLELLNVSGADNVHMYTDHLTERSRSEMPQLPETPESFSELIDYYHTRGMPTEIEFIDPRKCTATQNELDSVKVSAIEKAVAENGGHLNKVGETIVVSDEYGVVDGHHRWAAVSGYAITHPDTTIRVLHVKAPIEDVLAVSSDFSVEKGIQSESISAPMRNVAAEKVELFASTDRFDYTDKFEYKKWELRRKKPKG